MPSSFFCASLTIFPTSSADSVDYSQITRKKINTDTQLLYGDSVFDTITKEDCTGSGTKSDPYVVHSTKVFLYLQGNGISGLNIDNKYFELACDVVLNDESYDDNGNPISGDGVVYKWEPINYGRNAFFDGKNHSIKGLYLNRPET